MQATCWKSDEFQYILQPVSCSYPIFQIKKHICTFYIDIHSLKYFQSIYRSCCKVRMQFVTCKLGDCRVWTLTNPINSKPKHNSGGGIGIRTDSYSLRVCCMGKLGWMMMSVENSGYGYWVWKIFYVIITWSMLRDNALLKLSSLSSLSTTADSDSESVHIEKLGKHPTSCL